MGRLQQRILDGKFTEHYVFHSNALSACSCAVSLAEPGAKSNSCVGHAQHSSFPTGIDLARYHHLLPDLSFHTRVDGLLTGRTDD